MEGWKAASGVYAYLWVYIMVLWLCEADWLSELVNHFVSILPQGYVFVFLNLIFFVCFSFGAVPLQLLSVMVTQLYMIHVNDAQYHTGTLCDSPISYTLLVAINGRHPT